MTEVLALLSSAGAELVDPVEIPHARDYDDAELEVLLYEFKDGLNRYLAALPPSLSSGLPRTLAEIIEWNRRDAARSMPWFGQELFERAEAKGPLTEKPYLDALASCRRLSRDEGLDAALAKHRLDALIGPTLGPAYLTDWINGDAYGGSSSGPAAVAGYPHLTVPAGAVHGLPWGLSFVGPAWSDARILRLGHAFETATRARRPPRFSATIELA
jgi:amidase